MGELHEAAEVGDAERVRKLLGNGADPGEQDEDGVTPLQVAAGSGHVELVRLLLERGARVDATDRLGDTALHEAAASGETDTVMVLLARGADPSARNLDGDTARDVASRSARIETARALATWGAPEASERPPASTFPARWGALVVDAGVVLVGTVLIDLALAAAGGVSRVLEWAPYANPVCAWLYFAAMESCRAQGTVGKMCEGLQVCDLHGRRISFLRASGRHLAKLLSLVPLGAGFAMAAYTPGNRALHDMVAGTRVVFRTPEGGTEERAATGKSR
jgi:uncharacterized RDD family membrane protein YckC